MTDETLLTGSTILLFGRKIGDLKLVPGGYNQDGANQFVKQNLKLKDATFARIYSFSYDGGYYDLDTPALFLVHGEGNDPNAPRPPGNVSPGPGDLDAVGVAAQDARFAPDIKYWPYESSEFSVRLDVSTGMLEEILLYAELADYDDGMQFGGGKVGGGKVGGGKVGGGKVGGGKVGGGKVGGGKVGGGKVGGGKVGG